MGGAFSSRRSRRVVLVTLGLGAVALAAALWFASGAVPAPIREPLVTTAATLRGPGVVRVLAGTAGLYALVRVLAGRSRRAVAPGFSETDPERPHRVAPAAGEEFERAVAAAVAEVAEAGDPREGGERVRERLRATATATLQRRADLPTGAASAVVARGTWTDDRIAAAFLGGESAPPYPVAERMRGWIRPGVAFRRRVEDAVDAIATLNEEGAIPAEGTDPAEPGPAGGKGSPASDPDEGKDSPAPEPVEGKDATEPGPEGRTDAAEPEAGEPPAGGESG